MKKFIQKIENLELDDCEIKIDQNLSKYTTIKLGNPGVLIIVKSVESLKKILFFAAENQFLYHLVGWGANQVIINTQNVIFIKLDLPSIDQCQKVQDIYHFSASFPLNQMTSFAQKNNLKGWEVFTGIPASFGGAIAMNAGTNLGEIGPLIEEVTVLTPTQEIKVYSKNQCQFSYRKNHFLMPGEIILSAKIKHLGVESGIGEKIQSYMEMRKKTQPLTTRNCGSVFKNSKNLAAGLANDLIGLKGFAYNGLQVSYKHGNFIENIDAHDPKDFLKLIAQLREEMERYTGIEFELEVKIY